MLLIHYSVTRLWANLRCHARPKSFSTIEWAMQKPRGCYRKKPRLVSGFLLCRFGDREVGVFLLVILGVYLGYFTGVKETSERYESDNKPVIIVRHEKMESPEPETPAEKEA